MMMMKQSIAHNASGHFQKQSVTDDLPELLISAQFQPFAETHLQRSFPPLISTQYRVEGTDEETEHFASHLLLTCINLHS